MTGGVEHFDSGRRCTRGDRTREGDADDDDFFSAYDRRIADAAAAVASQEQNLLIRVAYSALSLAHLVSMVLGEATVSGGGNHVNSGGSNMMEQLIAVQTVQALQSMMNSKDGWTGKNMLSLLFMTLMGTLKQSIEMMVQHVIQNRACLASYVARLLRGGWKTGLKVLVDVLTMRFFRDIVRRLFRRGNSEPKVRGEAVEEGDTHQRRDGNRRYGELPPERPRVGVPAATKHVIESSVFPRPGDAAMKNLTSFKQFIPFHQFVAAIDRAISTTMQLNTPRRAGARARERAPPRVHHLPSGAVPDARERRDGRGNSGAPPESTDGRISRAMHAVLSINPLHVIACDRNYCMTATMVHDAAEFVVDVRERALIEELRKLRREEEDDCTSVMKVGALDAGDVRITLRSAASAAEAAASAAEAAAEEAAETAAEAAETAAEAAETADVAKKDVVMLIERKTMADLAASVKDGRYRDQKARMRAHADLVVYVLEGWSGFGEPLSAASRRAGLNERALHTCFWNMFAGGSDGKVRVLATRDVADTAACVNGLWERREMWADVATSASVSAASMSASERGHGGYHAEQRLLHAKRGKNITPQSCFAAQLCQVPGVSAKIAANLVARWPTMAVLFAEMLPLDREGRVRALEALALIGKKNAIKIAEHMGL